ncbi:MAG: hypothetical protein V3R25_07205 [Nitrosomonadaceae bacterium]
MHFLPKGKNGRRENGSLSFDRRDGVLVQFGVGAQHIDLLPQVIEPDGVRQNGRFLRLHEQAGVPDL